jgi:signal peptidase II
VSPKAIPFLIAGLLVIADQITKMAIRSSVSQAETIAVIPGFFNIVHAENPGVAFSILADAPSTWRNAFLIGISSVAVAVLTYLILSGASSGNPALRVALALILGGAFGNLVDRALHQTVTDFVEVYTGSHYFPAFNVADSGITVGAVLLFLDMWRSRGPRHVS